MKLKASVISLPVVVSCGVVGLYLYLHRPIWENPPDAPPNKPLSYRPRKSLDTGGFMLALYSLKPLQDPTDLEETDVLTFDMHPILVALVNAVKAMTTRIETLETR